MKRFSAILTFVILFGGFITINIVGNAKAENPFFLPYVSCGMSDFDGTAPEAICDRNEATTTYSKTGTAYPHYAVFTLNGTFFLTSVSVKWADTASADRPAYGEIQYWDGTTWQFAAVVHHDPLATTNFSHAMPFVSTRAIRIYGFTGTTYMGIAEVTAFGLHHIVASPNIDSGYLKIDSCYASDYQSTFTGAKACDGNAATRWVSNAASYPHFLITNLSGTFQFTGLEIAWGDGDETGSEGLEMNVSVLQNGTWILVSGFSLTSILVSSSSIYETHLNLSTDSVRLDFRSRGGSVAYVDIYEFKPRGVTTQEAITCSADPTLPGCPSILNCSTNPDLPGCPIAASPSNASMILLAILIFVMVALIVLSFAADNQMILMLAAVDALFVAFQAVTITGNFIIGLLISVLAIALLVIPLMQYFEKSHTPA